MSRHDARGHLRVVLVLFLISLVFIWWPAQGHLSTIGRAFPMIPVWVFTSMELFELPLAYLAFVAICTRPRQHGLIVVGNLNFWFMVSMIPIVIAVSPAGWILGSIEFCKLVRRLRYHDESARADFREISAP
jgi:hypothetical protein